jgi:hypothetical protein
VSRRYEVITEWQTSDRYVFDTEDGPVVLYRQYADIRDRKNNDVYSQGAFRVLAKYQETGKSHTRARTFYGELAWNSSHRLYDDILVKVRFGL